MMMLSSLSMVSGTDDSIQEQRLNNMSVKLDAALNRLKSILPLKERQEACGEQVKALHQQILRSFVTRGRILSRDEMVSGLSDPEAAIEALKSHDMVVFGADGEPVGAYPFTMEAREHEVQVNGNRVNAMCALDALSVSPMFGVETQITSRCRVTGDPVTIRQFGSVIHNLDEAGDIRFGIVWGAANADSCCADSLCTEMIFLRDGEIARQWLAEDPGNREVFSLQEAVEFGSRFFVPLMS
jgi:Alkylmercury lyase